MMKKLLILGCGDIGKRVLKILINWQVIAPSRSELDLDRPDFKKIPLKIDALLYCIPPNKNESADKRITKLLEFWRRNSSSAPSHIIYISTTGVYGDYSGAWTNESSNINPTTTRAILRADAEHQLCTFTKKNKTSLTILRSPGIYALERLPLKRLHECKPILNSNEDIYSNHIHADDLAMMCVAALNKENDLSIYNACDDHPIKMGDWFCALAKVMNLTTPQRHNKKNLTQLLSPLELSFISESRRLSNQKIKDELGISLQYPSVLDFLNKHQNILSQPT